MAAIFISVHSNTPSVTSMSNNLGLYSVTTHPYIRPAYNPVLPLMNRDVPMNFTRELHLLSDSVALCLHMTDLIQGMTVGGHMPPDIVMELCRQRLLPTYVIQASLRLAQLPRARNVIGRLAGPTPREAIWLLYSIHQFANLSPDPQSFIEQSSYRPEEIISNASYSFVGKQESGIMLLRTYPDNIITRIPEYFRTSQIPNTTNLTDLTPGHNETVRPIRTLLRNVYTRPAAQSNSNSSGSLFSGGRQQNNVQTKSMSEQPNLSLLNALTSDTNSNWLSTVYEGMSGSMGLYLRYGHTVYIFWAGSLLSENHGLEELSTSEGPFEDWSPSEQNVDQVGEDEIQNEQEIEDQAIQESY